MESIQNFFISISILPSPDGTPRWIKLRNMAFGAIMFIMLLIIIISSVTFFFKYRSIDLENALIAVGEISGFGYPFYSLAAGYKCRRQIKQLFNEFETIRRKYPSEFIETANQRGEFVAKFFLKYSIIGWLFSNLILSGSGYIYYVMKSDQVEIDNLYDSFKFIWPWNQDTVSGWFIDSMIINVLVGFPYILIVGVFLSFFITVCEYHQAFCKYHGTLLIPTNDRTFIHSLQHAIRFHITIKRLFQQSADLFSTFILVLLILNIIFLSDAIFQMDLAITHMDLIFFLMLYSVLTSGSLLFLYCYSGQTATDCYLNIADRVYKLNWYDRPKYLQKYFPMIIQNAQKPIYYHGFGMAYLSLNMYCRILRTVISYYMMFKTLAAEP